MREDRQSKFEQINSFITFEDVIALALARSKKHSFKSNTTPWCEALLELKNKYSDKIPELQEIYFNDRPPLPPQSDQVYQIFTTLARSGEMSLPNPQFVKIVISKSQKNRILRALGHSLDKYDALINEIVPILEEKVAIR